MKKIFHLTAHGKRELEDELETLLQNRTEIANRIAEARGFGDLSENAEYSAARENQAQSEARIKEIQKILANYEIIESDGAKNGVNLGDKVELKSGKKTVEYEIVGAVEADPLNGKISDESALGREILGKKIGEKVAVSTPKGEKIYEILAIS